MKLRYTLPAIADLRSILDHFLVFHEVTATEIIIHAVRHSARDPSGMPGSA